MPFSLNHFSRRSFLKGSLAAGAGTLVACGPDRRLSQQHEAEFLAGLRDPNRLAIFSDTHVNADSATIERSNNMTSNLANCIQQVLACDFVTGAPSVVLINGDLAHRSGESGDYKQFVSLMMPLVDAGMPVHLALGNHDHRERFWSSVTAPEFADRARIAALGSNQVLRLYMPTADILMLDSLDKTLQTPGLLGAQQLSWLKDALDDPSRAHRNIVIFVHHNPPLPVPLTVPATQPATQPKFIGLSDGQELLDLLIPRKKVKALFYGHTHQWKRTAIEGLHIVNIPAIAYAFGPEPLGWIDCRLNATGAKLQLNCVDPANVRNGDRVDLPWRT